MIKVSIFVCLWSILLRFDCHIRVDACRSRINHIHVVLELLLRCIRLMLTIELLICDARILWLDSLY